MSFAHQLNEQYLSPTPRAVISGRMKILVFPQEVKSARNPDFDQLKNFLETFPEQDASVALLCQNIKGVFGATK